MTQSEDTECQLVLRPSVPFRVNEPRDTVEVRVKCPDKFACANLHVSSCWSPLI
jgi:hypothetical protein